MVNNNDVIAKVLATAKPDAAMAMEAIKKANETIIMLSNQLKIAEARWDEMFIILGTVLNKYGREVRLTEDDLIPLSAQDYKITAEKVDDTGERVVRLMHVTEEVGRVVP